MSVGTASITAAITQGTKRIILAGDKVWFRKLVSVTASGFSGHTPANLVLMVYRGSTLVAQASSPVDGGTTCVFSLDTNTSEMEDAMDGVDYGAIREFDLYIYDVDTSSLELLGSCVLKVYATKDYASISPTPPISATTLFIGSFAFYNGKTYLRSATDGLYYEFAAYGAGGTVSESLSTTGITISGSP